MYGYGSNKKEKEMTTIQKQKMIKLIHTQKTRAGIDNEAYCCILMGAADVQSSKDLETMTQFSAVIAAPTGSSLPKAKRLLENQLNQFPAIYTRW